MSQLDARPQGILQRLSYLSRRRPIRDAVVAILVIIVATVGGISIDFYDHFYTWTRSTEAWEVDELFSLLVVGSIMGTWYTLRRLQDVRCEVAMRQRLEQTLQQRLAERTAVAQVTWAITATASLSDVLQLIVEQACRLLGTERSVLMVLHSETNHTDLRCVAQHGMSEHFVQHAHPSHWRDGVSVLALAERQPIWVADVLNDARLPLSPGMRALIEAEGYRAMLAVPLLAHDQAVGILAVCRDTVYAFPQDEVDLLQLFAAQAAVALENARLFTEMNRRRTQLAQILEINKRLAASRDLNEIFSVATQEALQLVGGDAGSILLRQQDRLVVAWHSQGNFASPSIHTLLQGEGMAWQAALDNRVIVVTDVQAHPELSSTYKTRAAESGLCALIHVPMQAHGTVVGVLSVTSQQPQYFVQDEIDALRMCAEQVALVLEKARLLDEIRQQNTQLAESNTTLQGEITARQHIRQDLQDSEARYRVLVEGSVQGMVIHQEENIRFTNIATARLFGYESPAELLGQSIHRLVAPYDLNRLRGYTSACLEGAQASVQYEWQGVRKDRSLLWVESVVSVVTWEGTPSILMTFLDVSARRDLQTRLLQGQKTQTLGVLASDIAHNLNNVLTAISGYTELALADLPPASTVRHSVQQVFAAAQRSSHLVQQLLTYSRPQLPQRQPVQLVLILEEVLLLVRASLPTTITIVQPATYDTSLVLADPSQLYQVVLNLCTNAAHAMRHTGGILHLALQAFKGDTTFATQHPELLPGPYVRLTVRDTGHGIDPTIVGRIFEPFFTTKDVDGGTGIGLAIVHDIVANHSGSITVDSTPGQGTTVEIYFPQYIAPLSNTAASASSASAWHQPDALCNVPRDNCVMIAPYYE